MLSLVPPGRFGRLWCAAAILALGGLIYGTAAVLLARDPSFVGRIAWSIPVFFVCAVAYIVPMFHFITQRTHQAIELLAPYLASSQRQADLHEAIDRRSVGWAVRSAAVGIGLWLLQSRLLSGSWENVWASLSSSFAFGTFAYGSLFVWVTMVVTMSALVQNALTFRQLVPELATDILEPSSYLPVGSMAVTSTLVSLGAMALMSIMWLGGPIDWWTTLPALVIFAPLVVLLLLLPVWPLHRRLLAHRRAAVDKAQQQLRSVSRSAMAEQVGIAEQAAALSLRREVSRLPVWPFDVGAIARFISYAVIVPLTWAGAALIEMLVNALLD
jgi:hypothetical protein